MSMSSVAFPIAEALPWLPEPKAYPTIYTYIAEGRIRAIGRRRHMALPEAEIRRLLLEERERLDAATRDHQQRYAAFEAAAEARGNKQT
jgi:hypothetical protein